MQSKYGFPIEMESGAEGFFTDFILKLAEKGSERSEKEARERAKNRKYEPSDLEKLVKQYSSKLMKEVKPYGTKITKMLPKSKEFKTLFNNIKKETIRDYGKEDWEMIEDDLYYFECNPELYDSNISVLSFSQDLMGYDGWDEFESLMVSEFNKIANKLKAPSGYKWIFTGPFDDETSIWCTLAETSTVGNESFNLFNDNYPLNITMDTLFNNIKDTFNANKNYPWTSPEAAIESTLDQMTGYEFSKYIENMEVEYEGTEGFFDGVKSLFSKKSKTVSVDMSRDQFIKEANKFFLSKKNELDSILKKYPKVCKDYYIETIYDKYDPEYNAINLRIDFSKGLNFVEDRNSDAFKVSTLFGCNEDGTRTFIDKVKKEFKDKFNIDPEIDGDTDCVFIGTPDIDKITFNDSSNSGTESFNIFDI